MKKTIALAGLVCLLSSCSALAACSGSVSSGITLSMGAPQNFSVRAAAGCNQLPSTSWTVGGSAIGSLVGATPNGVQVVLTPLTPGSGQMTVSGTGFSTLTVPITVNPSTFDVTQP